MLLALPAAIGMFWFVAAKTTGPGAMTSAWVGPLVLFAHAALPFYAFALQPARPWRLLTVGLGVVLAAEWAALLLTLYWPRPPEWNGEWAGVALVGLLLFTPAYALVASLVVAACVALRRRFSLRDVPTT
ncbi:MAG TPA: hypothetical protein VIF62_24340 [Labilithrix sp.]